MSYRDEKGALRAQVDELEDQLAAAQSKIEQLTGAAPTPVSEGETLGPVSGLGLPSSIRLEKVIEGTLSPEGYEALAGLIERRLRQRSSQVGARLETLGGQGRVQIVVKRGRTHVVLEHDWADRPAFTWVLTGMGAVLGGAGIAAVLHDAMHLTDAMMFAQLLWASPLVAGITAPLARRVARRQIETNLALRRGTFAALIELAEQHVTAPVRARVEVGGQVETAVEEDDAPSNERQDTSRPRTPEVDLAPRRARTMRAPDAHPKVAPRAPGSLDRRESDAREAVFAAWAATLKREHTVVTGAQDRWGV